MLQKTIEKILRARVYDVAVETPLDHAPHLSARLGNSVYLKREDLQPVFSFKLRGAYNKMALLDQRQKAAGVIAASAGNHAQGVAFSAQHLGIDALIVMPTTTPEIKVRAVQARGAEIVLFGDSYDEACGHALQLAEKGDLTFIHPYDDVDVIAGIAAYIKFVRPEIRVIGVEPDDADCLNRALQARRRVTIRQVGLFADGVAVKQIGREPWRLARQCVDEVICVNTDEICAAIKDIFDDTRSVAEPAGALAVAGLKKYSEGSVVSGATLVAVESGANINFDRLRYVAERAEVGEHREILLAVTIPERRGSFLQFCQALGSRNVTEFNYRYFDRAAAQIFVGVSSSASRTDRAELIALLRGKGFAVTDMTENDLAKEHVRYMVGGHAPGLLGEVVYSLEFPERPGALLKFLTTMGGRWNISLFHYRNHGAAFGKVLIGLQIAREEHRLFRRNLDDLGFTYREESANPAYRLFAGGNEQDAGEK